MGCLSKDADVIISVEPVVACAYGRRRRYVLCKKRRKAERRRVEPNVPDALVRRKYGVEIFK